MKSWPDLRLLDVIGIELPIIQAPMAGETTPELVAAVSEAGGLGSLGCATLSCEEVRNEVKRIRELTSKPLISTSSVTTLLRRTRAEAKLGSAAHPILCRAWARTDRRRPWSPQTNIQHRNGGVPSRPFSAGLKLPFRLAISADSRAPPLARLPHPKLGNEPSGGTLACCQGGRCHHRARR